MDDATLKALLADDGLAERDTMFTYAVMQKVAQRRLAGEIAGLTAPALATATLLWVLAPRLPAMLEGWRFDGWAPLLIGAIVTLSVALPLGLLRPAPRMTET